MKNQEKDFEKIKNHLKEMGFIYQGSQIYGGLANTWDYGPLGFLLLKNIKDLWIKEFITKEPNIYGLDSKILMNPKVWEASGHINNFSDPLIENKVNGKRYRADHIIEQLFPDINAESMNNQELGDFIKKNIPKFDSSDCNWTDVRKFHLMFETKQGVIEDSKSQIYLRPETAQGIFVNFRNVQRSMRTKLPFGIAQIGKSFRNEVTPGNYTFRTREFEQMELEYFVEPEDDEKTFSYFVDKSLEFIQSLGIKKSSICLRKHDQSELSHYSKATSDIEFEFPFGKGELMGVANRTDYDLKSHMKSSGESLEYLDTQTNKKIIPYVIEPSMGVDRLALALLTDAFEIENLENKSSRVVLRLDQKVVPYQVAILPLSKKHHNEYSKKVFHNIINKNIRATFDENGSIGKRYRRQDAIGTPIVITVIDKTESENKVTIRFRDSMEQKEINLDDLEKYFNSKI